MRLIMILLLGLFVFGCSLAPKKPRAELKIPYKAVLVEKMIALSSRSPASIQRSFGKMSLKRVYFKALFEQYVDLSNYLGSEVSSLYCPQFHHDRVKIESRIQVIPEMNTPQAKMSSHREYFPELAWNENFAIQDLHDELKAQVEFLCEWGESDDTYRFENLITYHAHKPSFQMNPQSIESLLKIPVFAQFYLLKMMGVSSSQLSENEERLIGTTKVYWFSNFVFEAANERKTFLKNQMVKR